MIETMFSEQCFQGDTQSKEKKINPLWSRQSSNHSNCLLKQVDTLKNIRWIYISDINQVNKFEIKHIFLYSSIFKCKSQVHTRIPLVQSSINSYNPFDQCAMYVRMHSGHHLFSGQSTEYIGTVKLLEPYCLLCWTS